MRKGSFLKSRFKQKADWLAIFTSLTCTDNFNCAYIRANRSPGPPDFTYSFTANTLTAQAHCF